MRCTTAGGRYRGHRGSRRRLLIGMRRCRRARHSAAVRRRWVDAGGRRRTTWRACSCELARAAGRMGPRAAGQGAGTNAHWASVRGRWPAMQSGSSCRARSVLAARRSAIQCRPWPEHPPQLPAARAQPPLLPQRLSCVQPHAAALFRRYPLPAHLPPQPPETAQPLPLPQRLSYLQRLPTIVGLGPHI